MSAFVFVAALQARSLVILAKSFSPLAPHSKWGRIRAGNLHLWQISHAAYSKQDRIREILIIDIVRLFGVQLRGFVRVWLKTGLIIRGSVVYKFAVIDTTRDHHQP
jgi:hypothetical protein